MKNLGLLAQVAVAGITAEAAMAYGSQYWRARYAA